MLINNNEYLDIVETIKLEIKKRTIQSRCKRKQRADYVILQHRQDYQ